VLTFITGPVRSGKSSLAQRLAISAGKGVIFAATAAWDDEDPEWTARIERHRAERPSEWRVIETAGRHGVDLAGALRTAKATDVVLIESLGTWISDVLARRAEQIGEDNVALLEGVEADAGRLIDAIDASAADVIVVSEEVGWGVVPAYPAGRVFRDVMGHANRRLCAAAGRAYLIVSGVALDLKGALQFEAL
jgi:adenosylcobinamide kinase/adenosylcobinamide-phosphate guanylyltransferase